MILLQKSYNNLTLSAFPLGLTFLHKRIIIPFERQIQHRERIDTMNVTKESIIGDVLDAAPDTAQFFLDIGMHCLGCPMSRGESIKDACAVHGTDPDSLVSKINSFLNSDKN